MNAAVLEGLDAVAAAVFVLRDRRILWANRAAAALTGYGGDQLCRMSLVDLLASPPNDLDGECDLITAEKRRLRVDVRVHAAEIDGEAVELATVSQRPDNPYRRAVEGAPDGFYLLQSCRDSSGGITDFVVADVNVQGEVLSSRSKGQMVGRSIRELFPAHYISLYLERFVQVAETGEPLDEDIDTSTREAPKRWYHHQIVPVEDGVALFIRDVTDQKRSEAALHQSESRYRALLDQSNDYVTLIDLNGNYILVNQPFASTLGYTSDEMVGTPILLYIPSDETSNSELMLQTVLSGEKIPLYERMFERKDGSRFLCELNVSLVRDADGSPLYIQSLMRDVTWRREAERALRESEERYRIISELISDYAYAFRVEPDGTLVHEWITDLVQAHDGLHPRRSGCHRTASALSPG